LAVERKHLVISTIAGVFVAGLIIAGTILLPYISGIISTQQEITSIPDENPPEVTNPPPVIETSKMGTLVLMLTDAPPRTLKYLYIKVDEVRVQMKGNKTGEGPVLSFSMTPTIYNVTALKESPAQIGISSVPAGEYTGIWLHILEANATFTDNPGVNVTLKIVAKGWLKMPLYFKVNPKDLTVIVLDFDMAQTHVSQGMVLTPVIKPKQILGP
jgi:hypothetical protein